MPGLGGRIVHFGIQRPIGEGAVRKVLFIFSVLSDSDVEWLATTGERMHLDPGNVLIPVGARVENLYFVLDGRLVVKTKAGDPIAFLESGEIIGEMSLVDPAPTTVSVEVASESTVLRLSDATVREKLETDLGFASRFYRALCVFMADRMRQTTQRFGYGKASDDKNAKDELNDDLLDNVHLAGARFDRMLRRLAG
jgi:CRP/FNR family transcriptional regulator, cyclic AMP receptor protein